jgi:hypothetical protein
LKTLKSRFKLKIKPKYGYNYNPIKDVFPSAAECFAFVLRKNETSAWKVVHLILESLEGTASSALTTETHRQAWAFRIILQIRELEGMHCAIGRQGTCHHQSHPVPGRMALHGVCLGRLCQFRAEARRLT